MRLESLTVRGIGPIKGEIHIDVSGLPGTVVVIHGDNTVGKTTALESYAAAVSKTLKTPSRGLLKSLAVARDSLVEVKVVNGAPYTIRHLFDGVSGNTESLVLGADGEPALESSKVSEFKEWAATHMPDPDVFLASCFGAQRQAKLIEATDGERKSLLLRALGLEKLERLAEDARKRAGAAANELTTIAARLDELGGVDVAAAEAGLESAKQAAGEAEEELARGRMELDQARTLVAEAERVEERNAEKRRQRVDLAQRIEKAEYDVTAAEAQVGQARREVADLDTKIRNNREVLEKREAIEGAVRRRDELATEIAAAEEQLRTFSLESESARKEQARVEREAAAARKRAAQQRQRADRIQQELQRSEKGVEAARALPERRAELKRAKSEQAAAEAELDQLRGQRLQGAEERIDGLRGALVEIADADDAVDDSDQRMAGVSRLARHTIRNDDEAVDLAEKLPGQLRAAEERLTALRTAVDGVDGIAIRVAACAELAALADRAEADRRELEEVEGQIASEDQTAQDHAHQVDELGTRLLAIGDQRNTADRRLVRLQDELSSLKDLVALKAPLDLAEQRIADRTAQREQATERVREADRRLEGACAAVDEVRVQLAATPEPEAPPSAPTARAVATLQDRVSGAEKAARDVHAAVSVAERDLVDARGAAERAEDLAAQKRDIEATVADWKRLAADLGRDGLQASEIDCAGPELTELVNDLLRRCVGPRYSLRFETTKLDAKGKRELEGMPIIITDTENGYEGDVRGGSGGEWSLLGEAISLALTMLAVRRSGLEGITLIRDESGAALSPENRRAYVSMLRRAAEIVGADKVLLVTHSEDVWEMADSRLEVTRDGVRVH